MPTLHHFGVAKKGNLKLRLGVWSRLQYKLALETCTEYKVKSKALLMLVFASFNFRSLNFGLRGRS